MSYQKWARRVVLGVLALLTCLAAPSGATLVPGGGPKSLDCLAVFDTPVVLKPNVRQIRCTDGDPSCDGDGIVNGECRFPITVCANSTAVSQCSLNGVQSMFVQHAQDNGDPRFDPDFQALQSRIDNQIDPPSTTSDDCTAASNITVRLKGPFAGNRCRQNSKTLRLTTTSTFQVNRFITDTDTMRLVCRPAQGSCDPMSLFSGTFDRIQKQIFNTSCALSGCHDSQSTQANLLLEIGASYAQTVNAAPTNFTAQGLGWNRITPGDPQMSFLYHKVTGDLGVGLGSRMPLGRPALAPRLVEIIRLWIEAGAPATGWVPGTDS